VLVISAERESVQEERLRGARECKGAAERDGEEEVDCARGCVGGGERGAPGEGGVLLDAEAAEAPSLLTGEAPVPTRARRARARRA